MNAPCVPDFKPLEVEEFGLSINGLTKLEESGYLWVEAPLTDSDVCEVHVEAFRHLQRLARFATRFGDDQSAIEIYISAQSHISRNQLRGLLAKTSLLLKKITPDAAPS